MVYLAELSVRATVWFKIIRIYSQSMSCIHRQKHLDDDATGWQTGLIALTNRSDVSYFVAVNFLPQNTPDAVFC